MCSESLFFYRIILKCSPKNNSLSNSATLFVNESKRLINLNALLLKSEAVNANATVR